jgi:hypothetical protein
MRMRRRRLFEKPSAGDWQRIMAGMLDGIRGHLARSTKKAHRQALDAVRERLLAADTPAKRKRAAGEIDRLLSGEPCYRAARSRYVRKELGIEPEQYDVLLAELRRQAGMG